MQVAKAERPQQRLRLLHPAAQVAVNEHDPPAFNADLSALGQRGQVSVVVAADRFDRSDLFELRDGLRRDDVAGMQDEVDSAQRLEKAIGQAVEKLGAVGVSDHSDSRRHQGLSGCSRSFNSAALRERKWFGR